ncbi:hypothetical protein KKA27_01465 [Patescibacteria group bacterium]|nr:hypothetical protein [Patescibacteria group bacterium]
MENGTENGDAKKRVRELYYIACAIFVILFTLLTLEFFGIGIMPTFLTEILLGIIATYAVANAKLKHSGENEIIQRPGQYFVYASWAYIVVIGICHFVSGSSISHHVVEAVGGITVIFGGTTYLKVALTPRKKEKE